MESFCLYAAIFCLEPTSKGNLKMSIANVGADTAVNEDNRDPAAVESRQFIVFSFFFLPDVSLKVCQTLPKKVSPASVQP